MKLIFLVQNNNINIVLTNFVFSAILCTWAAVLIGIIIEKSSNLSKISKFLIITILGLLINSLLSNAIFFNSLLMSEDYNDYINLTCNYYSYILKFILMIFFFYFIIKEEKYNIYCDGEKITSFHKKYYFKYLMGIFKYKNK